MTNIFCPHRLESLPESCSRSVTFYVPLFGNPALHYRIQSGTPLLHIQARLIQPIIPLSTWIPKVYYHIRKASLLVPILSQINPAHNCPPYVDPKGIHNAPLLVPILSHIHPVRLFLTRLFKIHFNIILPSTDGCSKLSSNAKHRNHGRDLRLFFPSVQSVP